METAEYELFSDCFQEAYLKVKGDKFFLRLWEQIKMDSFNATASFWGLSKIEELKTLWRCCPLFPDYEQAWENTCVLIFLTSSQKCKSSSNLDLVCTDEHL